MDVMEKLVELLENSFKKQYEKRCLLTEPHTVEDLIANGVTVQKWFSVNSPPKENGEYLCYFKHEHEIPDVICKNTYYGSGRWMSEPGRLTHWAYLPQPPKGE